ncbi:endonuclease/exonuclease/phosphatase family protein [Streptomyces sp. AC495_CC817]|uniref:endonuclease/exonuclease/phosphatase family protein n=1 Tax=Streptomyces sp. AC495_CC817 TaxID=2823900 RepID=UPI001C25E890|nr:endonuclease/exonuclease/phosphatase family protein [Streptomyces sp. AC495_CC817]
MARAVAVVSVLALLAIVCTWVPGIVGTAGAAVLPWLGVVLLIVLVIALVFARRTLLVTLVPVLAWVIAIAPSLPAPGAANDAPALTIVSQNVRAHSGGAAASAAELAASGADVIALTELDAESLAAAKDALAESYPHSYAVGTVGVWSRYPLADAEPLSLGLSWKRALRVTVQEPGAATAVYVLHAASVRPGHQDGRDTMLSGLAQTVSADESPSLVVVGDFNAASTDPALNDLRGQLDWVRPTDGSLGLTWPAAFPLTRIDQVFSRGVTVVSSTTVRAGNSDHLATKTVFAG